MPGTGGPIPLPPTVARALPVRFVSSLATKDSWSANDKCGWADCNEVPEMFLLVSPSMLVSDVLLSGDDNAGDPNFPSSSLHAPGDSLGKEACALLSWMLIFPPISSPLAAACSCNAQCILNQLDLLPYL